MARDSQRSKLYQAENVLEKFSKPFPSIQAIEGYIQEVKTTLLDAPIFHDTLIRKIIVKDGRGARRALATSNWVSYPAWARKTHIVLHELAHLMTDRYLWNQRVYDEKRAIFVPRSSEAAPHGPEFAYCYAYLVARMMGGEAVLALLTAFGERRVQVNAEVWKQNH